MTPENFATAAADMIEYAIEQNPWLKTQLEVDAGYTKRAVERAIANLLEHGADRSALTRLLCHDRIEPAARMTLYPTDTDRAAMAAHELSYLRAFHGMMDIAAEADIDGNAIRAMMGANIVRRGHLAMLVALDSFVRD